MNNEKPCETYQHHQCQTYTATIALHTHDNERITHTIHLTATNNLHHCCIKHTIEQAYTKTHKNAIVTSLELTTQPIKPTDIHLTITK